MFTDTITLYNHYQDEWYRTVLRGVQVSIDSSLEISSKGEHQNLELIRVTIPYRKGYREPKDFVGKGFTFGLDNRDIIIVGETDEEVTDGNLLKLMRKFQHAGTIMSVNDNTNRTHLKHWKVIAR